eukprot:scaffold98908_cov47-Attheya_sp.AAC.1
MSLNPSQKAANELAMARMTLRATHSPFAPVPPPPPPASTPPPAPANLSARKLELEALRQQGLATIFNKHFTSVCAETERERAKTDAALAEIEARKTALRISGKSHEDGVGGASLSALDQMYMDLFRQREAVKKKERDAMLLYQSYITKFAHHPSSPLTPITAGPDLIDNTGMVPTMASRIQSEVNEHLAQAQAKDSQYVIPTIPPQSSAPLLPVYHDVQPSTASDSDSHTNHVMHTPPPVTYRQFLSPIPGSPESGTNTNTNTDHEDTIPAYEGQDPCSTPSTQGAEAEDTFMNPVQGQLGPSSSTFMGPSSFPKKKTQQMTTVSPQDVRQMLDIPEDEEPEETPAFFADEVQYFTNEHHNNNKYGYNIEDDDDDNCSMVSGLTMQTTMSDAEQRLADFLKNEKDAIRKLIDDECSVAPTVMSNKEHETSSQESESARVASKAAALQAEEMALMMQDAVAWATQAVSSPNNSNDDDDDDDDNASFVSSAQTVATVLGKPVLKHNGQEWVSYWSDEHDREYYHDVISGAVSWILPTKDDDACITSSHIMSPHSSSTQGFEATNESDNDDDDDDDDSVTVMDFLKKGTPSSSSSYTSHSSSTTRVSRQSSSRHSSNHSRNDSRNDSPRSVTSGQPLSHEDVMPEQGGVRKSSSRVKEYRQRLKRQQRRRRRRVALVCLLVAVLGVGYYYYSLDNTVSLDNVSVASILASASVTASALQSTVVTLLDQSKQRVQDFLIVDVVDKDKDQQVPPISKILEQETVSQPKKKSQVKQPQKPQQPADIMLEATTTAATTTGTTIQKNVKPNNKDDVKVAEKDPSPESERHMTTTHNNHGEETTEIIPNSDEAKPAVVPVLASSQISTVEKGSTAAMSSSLSLTDDATNASALIVSSPPEHVVPKVKARKACFIPFAYLVARKCRQPPPIFDLKALTDCMMQ